MSDSATTLGAVALLAVLVAPPMQLSADAVAAAWGVPTAVPTLVGAPSANTRTVSSHRIGGSEAVGTRVALARGHEVTSPSATRLPERELVALLRKIATAVPEDREQRRAFTPIFCALAKYPLRADTAQGSPVARAALYALTYWVLTEDSAVFLNFLSDGPQAIRALQALVTIVTAIPRDVDIDVAAPQLRERFREATLPAATGALAMLEDSILKGTKAALDALLFSERAPEETVRAHAVMFLRHAAKEGSTRAREAIGVLA